MIGAQPQWDVTVVSSARRLGLRAGERQLSRLSHFQAGACDVHRLCLFLWHRRRPTQNPRQVGWTLFLDGESESAGAQSFFHPAFGVSSISSFGRMACDRQEPACNSSRSLDIPLAFVALPLTVLQIRRAPSYCETTICSTETEC